jgi:hypothetical protein
MNGALDFQFVNADMTLTNSVTQPVRFFKRVTHEKSFLEKKSLFFDVCLKHSFLRQTISELCGHYARNTRRRLV